MAKTIGKEFAKIRHRQGLTMLEIADKCGLHESTVSNIERGRPVRWETVHLVLTVGLRFRQAGDEYKGMHALWLKQRAERAMAQPEDHASKSLSPHAIEAVKHFRNLVRGLDPEGAKKALAAARRAARSA